MEQKHKLLEQNKKLKEQLRELAKAMDEIIYKEKMNRNQKSSSKEEDEVIK